MRDAKGLWHLADSRRRRRERLHAAELYEWTLTGVERFAPVAEPDRRRKEDASYEFGNANSLLLRPIPDFF